VDEGNIAWVIENLSSKRNHSDLQDGRYGGQGDYSGFRRGFVVCQNV
jgi:hypothetical protein